MESIKKANDIEVLETYLENIIDCKITQNEFESTKQEQINTLLQIFQLSLQYFQYTDQYYSNLSAETQNETHQLKQKIEQNKNKLKLSKNEINKIKQEFQIKKQSFQKYKTFITLQPQYKCHICHSKFFQNEQYLDAHMSRRHANILPMNIFNPNFPIVKNVVFAEQLKHNQEDFENQMKHFYQKENIVKNDSIEKLESILFQNKKTQLQLQNQMQMKIQQMEYNHIENIQKKQLENQQQLQYLKQLTLTMSSLQKQIENLKDVPVFVEPTADGNQLGLSQQQVNSNQIQELKQLQQKQQQQFKLQQEQNKQQQQYQQQQQQLLLQQQLKLQQSHVQQLQKSQQQQFQIPTSQQQQIKQEINYKKELNENAIKLIDNYQLQSELVLNQSYEYANDDVEKELVEDLENESANSYQEQMINNQYEEEKEMIEINKYNVQKNSRKNSANQSKQQIQEENNLKNMNELDMYLSDSNKYISEKLDNNLKNIETNYSIEQLQNIESMPRQFSTKFGEDGFIMDSRREIEQIKTITKEDSQSIQVDKKKVIMFKHEDSMEDIDYLQTISDIDQKVQKLPAFIRISSEFD